MKSPNLIYIGAGVLALILILKSTGSSAATYSGLDLSYLSDYGSDDVSRLQSVENELASRGLSDLQIKMMLAQILQETGIFTDQANYNAVDNLHNFAGISSNGHLRAYNSVSDFVDDYLRVLNLGGNPPLEAGSIADFNNRLKANGYYTDSKTTYGNNLNYYFNLLNQA